MFLCLHRGWQRFVCQMSKGWAINDTVHHLQSFVMSKWYLPTQKGGLEMTLCRYYQPVSSYWQKTTTDLTKPGKSNSKERFQTQRWSLAFLFQLFQEAWSHLLTQHWISECDHFEAAFSHQHEGNRFLLSREKKEELYVQVCLDKSPPACDPDRTKLKQMQRNEMKQILSLPKKYHEQVFKIISPASENIKTRLHNS